MVAASFPGARVTALPLSPELVQQHADVQVLCVTVHDPVPTESLEGFTDLRGVVTRSTGYDHLPLSWLEERGVVACNLGDYAVSSVVQHTLMCILTLLRRVPEAMAMTQGAARGGHDPPAWDRSRLVGRNLQDVQVGVLGTGRIGGALVRTLGSLGARVIGHDIAPDEALRAVPGFRYVDPLPVFLAGCDVLTLHVPLTKDTRHLVDRQALSRLPSGALLVNTSRGRVVDQLAVERALVAGRLAGYAADVLPGEPDPPQLYRFRDFTNVMMTPHLAAYDRRAIEARYTHAARGAQAILENDETVLERYRVPPSPAHRP